MRAAAMLADGLSAKGTSTRAYAGEPHDCSRARCQVCASGWLRWHLWLAMQVELLVHEGPRGGSPVAVPMARGDAGQWTAQVEAGSRRM
jgi:hypothetical protein